MMRIPLTDLPSQYATIRDQVNCFSFLGYRKGDYAIAEKAAEEAWALPTYPELTDEKQEYVVQTVADYYG